MKLVYATRTGNVQKLVDKIGYNDVLEIETGDERVNEDYLLITYTDGAGEIPQVVEDFLRNNLVGLKKIAVSGNMARHANTFCGAADEILKMKNVEVVARFNSAGDDSIVELINKALNN